MRHLYKSVLLCDLSDEEIEKIRAQFVPLLGLDEEEYKAITADYSHLICTNSFFSENRKVTLISALSKKVADRNDFDNFLL